MDLKYQILGLKGEIDRLKNQAASLQQQVRQLGNARQAAAAQTLLDVAHTDLSDCDGLINALSNTPDNITNAPAQLQEAGQKVSKVDEALSELSSFLESAKTSPQETKIVQPTNPTTRKPQIIQPISKTPQRRIESSNSPAPIDLRPSSTVTSNYAQMLTQPIVFALLVAAITRGA